MLIPTEHDQAIERFLSARPYYTPQHVINIASHMEAHNVPFCCECNDWHSSDEAHSLED